MNNQQNGSKRYGSMNNQQNGSQCNDRVVRERRKALKRGKAVRNQAVLNTQNLGKIMSNTDTACFFQCASMVLLSFICVLLIIK